MRRRVLLAASSALGLLGGCSWIFGGTVSDYTGYADYTGFMDEDFDDDGWYETEDCDDEDPDVNPGATEDCTNGIDDDCDDAIDDEDEDCIE